MGGFGHRFGQRVVGMDPRARRIRHEYIRPPQHAVARVNAFASVEANDDAFAAIFLRLVAHPILLRENSRRPTSNLQPPW